MGQASGRRKRRPWEPASPTPLLLEGGPGPHSPQDPGYCRAARPLHLSAEARRKRWAGRGRTRAGREGRRGRTGARGCCGARLLTGHKSASNPSRPVASAPPSLTQVPRGLSSTPTRAPGRRRGLQACVDRKPRQPAAARRLPAAPRAAAPFAGARSNRRSGVTTPPGPPQAGPRAPGACQAPPPCRGRRRPTYPGRGGRRRLPARRGSGGQAARGPAP